MWTWTNYNDELYHHGIKGQKWGVRRYQNEDGSLTQEGEDRYGRKYTRYTKKGRSRFQYDPSSGLAKYEQRYIHNRTNDIDRLYDREEKKFVKKNNRAMEKMNKAANDLLAKGPNANEKDKIKAKNKIQKYAQIAQKAREAYKKSEALRISDITKYESMGRYEIERDMSYSHLVREYYYTR